MKFRIGEGSKARRFPFSLPRRKRNPNNGVDGELGSKRIDSGSKDDAFFESRPWLDSDCEDDFYSVNGDFTPSRGSTPNHHFASPRRSQAYKSSSLGFSPNFQPESSPNHQKQPKLSELLQENQEGEEGATEKNTVNGTTKSGAKMENRNLNTNSGASPDASLNVEPEHKKEREFKSMQCCFPNFARSLSSTERRKPKMSPAQ